MRGQGKTEKQKLRRGAHDEASIHQNYDSVVDVVVPVEEILCPPNSKYARGLCTILINANSSTVTSPRKDPDVRPNTISES